MLLTPVIGLFLDYRGKSASVMILGSLLLIFVHLGFALGPASEVIAIALMIILGISFSLVPWSYVALLFQKSLMNNI